MSGRRLLVAFLALQVTIASLATAEIREIPRGTAGYAKTAIVGRELETIPLRYIGALEGFGGGPYDLHLVELEGPIAEEVGIANGMSGSPVYIDGELIGALAYRFGSRPKRAIAGVTPIESILSSDRGDGISGDEIAGLATPIGTPVTLIGVHPEVGRWLDDQFGELGLPLATTSAGGALIDSGEPLPEMVAGVPVGVQLVRGDMSVAATGTVTWVDDDRLFAFGHPFLGGGSVELPMVNAEVLHTLTDHAGSLKMANVGAEIGAVVEDRFSSIVGRFGQRARMLPVEVSVRGAGYGAIDAQFEVARDPSLAPILTASTFLNTLRGDIGYEIETTLLASGRILLGGGLPALEVHGASAGVGGADPVFPVGLSLFQNLQQLFANPAVEVDVESVEMEVEAVRGLRDYRLESALFDREPIEEGESLRIHCRLRAHRGGIVERSLDLEIPPRPAGTKQLQLVVGAEPAVDAALGGRFAHRLASVRDGAGLVGALSAQPRGNRLVAVLYRPGSATVAHQGALLDELPPTARALLSKAPQSARARRRPPVKGIVESGVVMDGPVSGVQVFRIPFEARKP